MKMSEDKVPGPPRDFIGYGRHVPKVMWPDEARVAVSLVINYEEGSEVQMSADGRNESILGEMSLGLESQYRDLALESVYEYGARAGIWRLQRMFDSRGIATTVFAAAVAVERNPEVAAYTMNAILAGGISLALQRNLQIIGAFAFLSGVRQKKFFQGYIMPALDSLNHRLQDDCFADYTVLRKTAAETLERYSRQQEG